MEDVKDRDMRDTTGDRFKEYEKAGELVLPSREPVILRLDGNSFSKFTKQHFEKPFDDRFEQAMNAAAIAVLEYCSGCYFAYVQSDEISIMLLNDQTEKTSPFLANRTQKLASLCASKASVAFNRSLREQNVGDFDAVFDCRAFVVPEEEVSDLFQWRQEDCYRNGIASTLYHTLRGKWGRKTAHKWMQGKGVRAYIRKLEELGISLDDIGEHRLYGRVIERDTFEVLKKDLMPAEAFQKLLDDGRIKDESETAIRSTWGVQKETPWFSDSRYVRSFRET